MGKPLFIDFLRSDCRSGYLTGCEHGRIFPVGYLGPRCVVLDMWRGSFVWVCDCEGYVPLFR